MRIRRLPKTTVSRKITFAALLFPQGNSLFEQSSKRKLARIRASDPILKQDTNTEEFYSISKAITELGGFRDTISPIQDSLFQHELANISRTLR